MPTDRYVPLDGIRVLSFELAFSLPAGTRALAELGAEVVRVAGPQRAGESYIAVIDGVFQSKDCIGIDLKTEAGRELAWRLVEKADVVCNNFTPKVMRRFGLSAEDIVASRPDVIALQLSGYGTPGPWSDFPAFGPSTEAAAGLNSLVGEPDDPPVRAGSGVFSDQLSGRFAALAVVAALERRRETGKGAVIDLSMSEAISTLLGPWIVEAQASGWAPARQGNRHPIFAPQGIYPCTGDDEWVAITVTSDDQWLDFRDEVGKTVLQQPDLESATSRHRQHDAIDAEISSWTADQDKHVITERLQQRGIAAGPVRKPHEAYFDEHLQERQAFQLVEHERPVLGYRAHPHLRLPWLVEGRERSRLTGVPDAGSHNEKILANWLMLGPEDVRRYEEQGALTARAVDVQERPAVRGAPVEDDAGERLGLPSEHETTT